MGRRNQFHQILLVLSVLEQLRKSGLLLVYLPNNALPFLIVDLILAECGKILASPVLARHIIQSEISRFIPADLFQKIFAFSEALQDLFISVLSNDWKIVKVIFTAIRIAPGKCVHFQLFRVVRNVGRFVVK